MRFNDNPNEDSCKTQQLKILNYLKKGNRITQLTSLRLFGCMRLGARIFDLKMQGYRIEDEYVINPQSKKRYKAYWLKGSSK